MSPYERAFLLATELEAVGSRHKIARIGRGRSGISDKEERALRTRGIPLHGAVGDFMTRSPHPPPSPGPTGKNIGTRPQPFRLYQMFGVEVISKGGRKGRVV